MSPTHIVCDAGAFTAGRVSHEIKGIFAKYPLRDKACPVKVRGIAVDLYIKWGIGGYFSGENRGYSILSSLLYLRVFIPHL